MTRSADKRRRTGSNKSAAVTRLEQQVAALRVELEEQSRLYAEALDHLATLESRGALEASGEVAMLEPVAVRALMQEHAQRERRHRGELEAVRAAQQLLIPHAPGDLAPGIDIAFSYEPAAEAGGDWLRFIPEPSASGVSILIGDVTGHGVGAAVITAVVTAALATVDALARWCLSPIDDDTPSPALAVHLGRLRQPREVLALLDDVVSHIGRGRYEMTCFAARYDHRTRAIHYANAGHNFPVLLRRERRQTIAHSLSARGDRLGAGAGAREQRAVQVVPGDMLLLYTDGLVESRDPAGREVGIRRVVDWLRGAYDRPVDEVRDHLRSELASWLDGHPAGDDVAFAVARVEP